MKPYYADDLVTIYNGDCADVLPTISMVDLVVTDPPYNEVNKRHTSDNGIRSFDKGDADALPVDATQLAADLAAISTGSVYVFCGTEQVSDLRAAFVDYGRTTRLGIWEKTNPSPMHGDKFWLSSIECCVFAHATNATWNLHCESPVWRGPTERDYRDLHPTPKPEWLIRKLILASSKPGDVVLDPYMGSGTTLKVAKDEGRRAIGIDINRDYCDVAVRRVSQQVLDLTGGAA